MSVGQKKSAVSTQAPCAVLVVGSGGREHAMVWSLAQDRRVGDIWVFPSNAGINREPRVRSVIGFAAARQTTLHWPMRPQDVDVLVQLARSLAVHYVLIGPEAPLALGLADALTAAGIATFGCGREAARLETSKIFAKEVMRSAGIAHARDAVFSTCSSALHFVRSEAFRDFSATGACVVKFDGLAAGKGVIVCDGAQQAQQAIGTLWRSYGQKDAQGRLCDAFSLVIEERLMGKECSAIAFCDGRSVRLMPLARDHKRLREADQGPNTGGMGAYAPVADVDAQEVARIEQEVFAPLLAELVRRGLPYCGVIFVGLMWESAAPDAAFRVLEFNCRFGDPEAQALLMLLRTPLLDVVRACCEQRLGESEVEFLQQSAVSVVLAAREYPGASGARTPVVIGPGVPGDAAQEGSEGWGVKLFHAATVQEESGAPLLSAGGRVLCASAKGADLREARERAYRLVRKVHFEGMQYRADIGVPTPARLGAGGTTSEGKRQASA